MQLPLSVRRDGSSTDGASRAWTRHGQYLRPGRHFVSLLEIPFDLLQTLVQLPRKEDKTSKALGSIFEHCPSTSRKRFTKRSQE